MKCVIKVIPPHSRESPSIRWKAEVNDQPNIFLSGNSYFQTLIQPMKYFEWPSSKYSRLLGVEWKPTHHFWEWWQLRGFRHNWKMDDVGWWFRAAGYLLMVETPPAFEPSVAVCLDIKYERLVKANTSKGQERNATLDPTKNKQKHPSW